MRRSIIAGIEIDFLESKITTQNEAAIHTLIDRREQSIHHLKVSHRRVEGSILILAPSRYCCWHSECVPTQQVKKDLLRQSMTKVSLEFEFQCKTFTVISKRAYKNKLSSYYNPLTCFIDSQKVGIYILCQLENQLSFVISGVTIILRLQ